MAKVAAPAPVPGSTLRAVSGRSSSKTTTATKRKTPSELRGEQLKRKNVIELVDESSASVRNSLRDMNGATLGAKKTDLPKNPRYVDTRMDELFPIRKNSIRLRLLSKKQNDKESDPAELVGNQKASTIPSNLEVEGLKQTACPEHTFISATVTKDAADQAHNVSGKCYERTFRTVTELSSVGEKFSALSNVEMDKALKGLAACEPPIVFPFSMESSEKNDNFISANFCSEFSIPGKKSPLDITLKTNMRIVSSSSVNWFHRLINGASLDGMFHFTSQVGSSKDQQMNSLTGSNSCTQKIKPNAFFSWVHPQSSLPPSVVSVLASSSGGDFMGKRELTWQDSFRSLYYMLRKNICKIFYVCTPQFVVLFTGEDNLDRSKRVCHAYISQSTRGLRSLLKEHDACFSMPLCNSKVEQVNAEVLVELSEIEKQNLGQARHVNSTFDVDNSPQSLLAFSGNKNVQGLYDFLLNYRSFVTSLTGIDVPTLCSPVPFENAALLAPEVRCKEVRRADHVSFTLKDANITDERQGSSSGLLYSIEIKDTYIPPWITSSVCDAMGSSGINFEASFVTESSSIGLNVGLDILRQKSSEGTELEGISDSFGIRSAIFSPHLRSGFLKSLKYSNECYTAFLSPV